jgi:quinol monooxygenase YgiN
MRYGLRRPPNVLPSFTKGVIEMRLYRYLVAVVLVSGAVVYQASAQTEPRQVASLVELEIVPTELERFLEAVRENGAATIKEPGCRQYDIMQSATNPNQLVLYEVYENEAAVQAHRASEHFKKYMAATANLVSKRQSRPLASVARYAKPAM